MDEEWLRKELEGTKPSKQKLSVALIPDVQTIQWHHAREEFAANEMMSKMAKVKGAYTKTDKGDRIWCIWTRTFGSDEAGDTLNILRLVIEGGYELSHTNGADVVDLDEGSQQKVKGVIEVLKAAQRQAAEWNMKDVQIWDPTLLIRKAVREMEPTNEVVHRDEESIASLRWHGPDSKGHPDIYWIGNEKYGWC